MKNGDPVPGPERTAVPRRTARNRQLLEALSEVQLLAIGQTPPREIFETLLSKILALTSSEYGFIGEVFAPEGGRPYLKIHAFVNLVWTEELEAFYRQAVAQGLEFRNLKTLFGEVIKTGRPLIANSPARDRRRGGVPPGHPPLRTFLGLPLVSGARLIGLVGIANRPGGYAKKWIAFLGPILITAARIIESLRNERRRIDAENALKRSAEEWERTFDSVPDLIAILDTEHRIVRSNKALADRLATTAPELAGRKCHEVFHGASAPPAFCPHRQLIADGQEHQAEIHEDRLGGDFVLTCSPLKDGDGRLVGSVQIARDITERKRNEDLRTRTEEALRTSLREKEVLLKEIHHRVKNNMQVISSLINLQAQKVEDEDIREMFFESQHRIRSMALVHDKLYRSKDLARIDFAGYIESLAAHLVHSLRVDPSRVKLALDVRDVALDVNTAIPLGLIINELISNSLKHAFPWNRPGTVRIFLRPIEDSRYRLIVSDDGIGFPAGVDVRRTDTLGLQIVSMLAEQLDGTIAVTQSGGAVFTIEFGELKYKARI
jgi:PAS domain S-box-containing protein